MSNVLGIHHVTAIAGDPQRNVDFYAGVLGLRLVKKTVNFDDPQTLHLYYGDEEGTPGSILTFFPWANMPRGRQGAGQAGVTSFAVLPTSIGYWTERLLRHGVTFEGPVRRFGESRLSFADPDGLLLEIVGTPGAEARRGWDGGPVPAEHAIRGVHAVTLWLHGAEPTVAVLGDTLGFRAVAEDAETRRFAAGDGGSGAIVDVRTVGGFWGGAMGVGVVHHVAFRVSDDAEQLAVREQVRRAGIATTPVIDRNYFHSVYFREPGGVLFELATDAPGFAIDEPRERLGERLMLPPQYEPMRAELEAILPPLRVPGREELATPAGAEDER